MNVPPELDTLRDWLRFAVSRFTQAGLAFGHGCANAYDEAAYLLLHALYLPPERIEPFLDAKLTHAEKGDLAELLTQRIEERVPAAYLTHEAWLGDFHFYVDERVIIPRSFIAELLRDAFAPHIVDPAAIRSALDLCTGSGCLAVLVAHAFSEADIDAADISSDALAVAQRNVSDYGLADRINLVRSDLFDNLPEKSYDLIISNPPYVTSVAMRTCRASTGTSRRSRSLAVKMAWMQCARSCAMHRASSSPRACSSSRSETTASPRRRRFRGCRFCGWRRRRRKRSEEHTSELQSH